ncbi:hypothetical protein LZG74_19770 [Dyadobacter sp. CY327]|uniref:DinB family protein n=1 Tax=Dyadobacter sp. CY327 TaxID=2907301 RepID=UPI001F47A5DE|nr:DinB family protein [Dyadobacter sp. CY327]MCE7072564.1 hypothetical protein [Dyadobacter sp. CY327]
MDIFNEDLIRYNSWANQQIIAILSANPAKVSDRCAELISHILNVHQIWNGKIKPTLGTYESWDVHPLVLMPEFDRLNTKSTLEILEHSIIGQAIEYQTKSGATIVNSVQEILYQIITHSSYHRGQIATELRNVGIEPTLTDYIYYKMTSAK